MRYLFDPEVFWVGRPPRARRAAQGDAPPIAVNDTLSVIRALGPVTVPVLDNDIDPEGQPLTLISAFAALGTAVAETDGTVTYTPPVGAPPGVVEFDTVVYEIADAAGQRDTGQIDITVSDPVLSVDETPASTLSVTSDEGSLDITVSEPAAFAGTYTLDPAELAAGPVNLVAPRITGTFAIGETLTAGAGLWAHDVLAEPVTQSWQWRRSGTDIPGQTGPEYSVAAGDIGPGISVAETLTDGFGSRTASSATVGTGFIPSGDAQLLGWWDAADAATISGTGNGVSTWADKAGSDPLTQNTGTREPQSGVRVLNGLNVLDFDGGRFLNRAQTVPASGNIAFHLALVIDSTDSAFEAVLALDATNDFQIDAASDTAFDGRLNASGIGSSVSLAGGPFSGALVLSALFDFTGGQAEVWIADTLRGTTPYTAKLDPGAVFYLMSNRSENALVDGAVAEVIITGNTGNRADHHAYLAEKWGLV